MSDQKKTDKRQGPTGSFTEDVKILKERLKELQLAKAEKRAVDLNTHLLTLKERMFASLGIPKEFLKDVKISSHMHDSVKLSVPAATAPQIAAAINQNVDKVHTLQHAARHYVGGKAKGSISLQNLAIIDKKLLWGMLYGANLGVSMGTPVSDVHAQVGKGTYKVIGVINECQVYLEPVGDGIMCQPVLRPEVLGIAGYEPACAECAYGMHCLRNRHPNVCSHCRATVSQHLVEGIGYVQYKKDTESEYCRLQQEDERISSACPLFKASVMVCTHCREPRPYVTRICVPIGKRRYKKTRVRSTPKPQRTFREHLLQHQSKERGNLHQRQQARHARKTIHEMAQQTKSRPPRGVKKRRA